MQLRDFIDQGGKIRGFNTKKVQDILADKDDSGKKAEEKRNRACFRKAKEFRQVHNWEFAESFMHRKKK